MTATPPTDLLAELPALRPGYRGRMCVYLDATMLHEGGYVPSVVYENESGYWPLTGRGEHSQPWYWGHDLDAAKAICATYNSQLGLSGDDVRAIVLSSMTAPR